MHGDKRVRCFLVGWDAAKMPACVQSGPGRTCKRMGFLNSSSSSKFGRCCKERQEAFCFPFEKPTAAAASSGEGSPSGLTLVKPEKGSARSTPAATCPLAAQAVAAVTGSTGEVWSLCLLAFRQQMQEPPLQTLCFTGSPPVAELFYRESVCRGA